MKLLTFVVAASFVLGSAAVVQAQPQPAAPPPPPPAAPPADSAAPPAERAAPPADPNTAVVSPVSGVVSAQPGAAPSPGAPVAQPAAPPPPPPSPMTAPPPQQPPQPPPSIQWQPSFAPMPAQADTTSEDTDTEKKKPSKLAWRETSFTWNHSATTTLLGIGRDNIGSEDEVYSWTFLFRPRVYVVDLPKDKLYVSADIGWDKELTDSPSTVQKRETLFQDLTLGTKYTRLLFESGGKDKGEYKTAVSLSGRLRFPTSKFSSSQGKYVTTFLGPSLTQQIKILGLNASALNYIKIDVAEVWGHLFSRSYTPTNPDLNWARQNASGQTILSDQLASGSFAMNTLTTEVIVEMPLVQDLTLLGRFGFLANFKHDFEAGGADSSCDVYVANKGCVEAQRDPTRTLYQPSTSFDLSLNYPIVKVVDLSIGYQNLSRQIGENGQRRNMFYSPDAQFYVDITANLDEIYLKISGRDAKKSSSTQTASR